MSKSAASVIISGARITAVSWTQAKEKTGKGYLGTVARFLPDRKGVVVRWDYGEKTDVKFDSPDILHVIDGKVSGVKHDQCCSSGMDCESMDKIHGFMFICQDCTDVYLCSFCYHSDKHDKNHVFLRVDSRNSPGERHERRTTSRKQALDGMDRGAVIIMCGHGVYDDLGQFVRKGDDAKDSGDAKLGTAGAKAKTSRYLSMFAQSSSKHDPNVGKIQNMTRQPEDKNFIAVNVEFSKVRSRVLPLGYKGEFAIKCIEPGPEKHRRYYVDHLPRLESYIKTLENAELPIATLPAGQYTQHVHAHDEEEEEETPYEFPEAPPDDAPRYEAAPSAKVNTPAVPPKDYKPSASTRPRPSLKQKVNTNYVNTAELGFRSETVGGNDQYNEIGFTGRRGRVVCDFPGDAPMQLPLTTGDIVEEVKPYDGQWLCGKSNGKKGYFPSVNVEIIEDHTSKQGITQSHPDSQTENKACVTIAFLGNQPNQLHLRKGDILEGVSTYNEYWCRGKLKGKLGYFPRANIEMLEREEQSPRNPTPDKSGEKSPRDLGNVQILGESADNYNIRKNSAKDLKQMERRSSRTEVKIKPFVTVKPSVSSIPTPPPRAVVDGPAAPKSKVRDRARLPTEEADMFAVGDPVVITQDTDKCGELQHGAIKDWIEEIQGRKGIVRSVSSSGDVLVDFQDQITSWLNPECLERWQPSGRRQAFAKEKEITLL